MAAPDRRTPHQITFVVLTTAVASYALLQSLVTPVLVTVATQLHTDQNTVTWVLTAYLLSASIFTPIMGRIGDIAGKEKMFVVTLIALAAGSLLAALAPSIGILILARAIQGIGGGVMPLAFGIIRDEFPPERVSAAVGSIASLSAVGAGVGIVLAGPIVDLLGYRWLFWIPMIVTAAAAVAAHFVVPESPVRQSGRISWAPAVLLSAWLVCLLLGLSEGPVWGWGSVRVIGLVVAAVVIAAGWIVVEQHAASPLIDMRMMRRRPVWANNLVALLVGAGMYSVLAFLPEFVQTPASAGYGFGASITESGLLILPATVTLFLAGQFAGRLGTWIGPRTVVMIGSLLAGVAIIGFGFVHGARWEVYLGTAVMGVGLGLAFASMSSLIVIAVPQEQTGVASGMNANIRTIGGSIGAALMTSVVTSHLLPGGLPAESGYRNGFALLGGLLVLAAAAAILIPRAARPDDVEFAHGELALVPGGTVVGDGRE